MAGSVSSSETKSPVCLHNQPLDAALSQIESSNQSDAASADTMHEGAARQNLSSGHQSASTRCEDRQATRKKRGKVAVQKRDTTQKYRQDEQIISECREGLLISLRSIADSDKTLI